MENNNYITAIDLGCSNVVAAIGVKGTDGKLQVKDLLIKPMKGIVRGELTNIESVTKILTDIVTEFNQRDGVDVKEAYISISGKQIQCAPNSYFVFVGNDGEIRQSDLYKLHENMNNVQPPQGMVILDRFPQNYTVDSEYTMNPVGMFGRQLGTTFNFVLAGQSHIERYNKALERVGLQCRKFIATPMASAYPVTTEDEKELGCAVVNIGSGTTEVCIWHNKIIKYLAVIPLGSDAINCDIRSTSIPDRYIEKLKTGHGYASTAAIPEERLNLSIKISGHTARENKLISYRDLSTLIESRMSQIIEFVLSEIKDSGYMDKLPSGLILTGGGSQLAGIEDLFKERTGYETRCATIDYDLSEHSVDNVTDPKAATAIGMLIMGFAENDLPIYEEPKADEPEDIPQDEPEEKPANERRKKKKRGNWIASFLDKTLGTEDEDDEKF